MIFYIQLHLFISSSSHYNSICGGLRNERLQMSPRYVRDLSDPTSKDAYPVTTSVASDTSSFLTRLVP